MLVQYQHLIFLTPDPTFEVEEDLTPIQRQIQADLWSPLPYHRTKWLHNIDGARSLLLQLERAAQNIRVQRAKQNALKDLGEKRIIIKRLKHKLEEIGRELEAMGDEAFNLPQSTEGRESVMDILRQRRKDKRVPEPTDLLQEGKPVKTNGRRNPKTERQKKRLVITCSTQHRIDHTTSWRTEHRGAN